MSRAEEIKHLLEKSRQMSVDETYPITEGEVIEFISSSFEFGFVCGALWQKQQDQARSAVEIAREEITEKACDAYCKVCGHYAHTTPTYICRKACDYYKKFKNYMKGK